MALLEYIPSVHYPRPRIKAIKEFCEKNANHIKWLGPTSLSLSLSLFFLSLCVSLSVFLFDIVLQKLVGWSGLGGTSTNPRTFTGLKRKWKLNGNPANPE